jgi:hypothetical protein
MHVPMLILPIGRDFRLWGGKTCLLRTPEDPLRAVKKQ